MPKEHLSYSSKITGSKETKWTNWPQWKVDKWMNYYVWTSVFLIVFTIIAVGVYVGLTEGGI